MLNVPTGTFHFAENFRRKLLIPRLAFGSDQSIQRVRLWKKCLLSRGSNAYESRLDTRGMYFLRYVAAEGVEAGAARRCHGNRFRARH